MDRSDPRVSPLYADLQGFPPLLVQVGSAETLLDTDGNARLDAGRRALASAGSFVREHIS
jgi:acetyl esterase/lipase